MLFATTSYFLERMGLKALEDLPPLAPQLPEVEELEAELGQLARASAGSAQTTPGLSSWTPIRSRSSLNDRARSGRTPQKVLAAAGIASRRACES